jgi:bifunctional non-homologous end joining protein LigD
LKAESVVLDGEVVALDAKGHPSFQALQHRAAHPKHGVAFYAFDLIHLDGQDLRRLPLEKSRARLPKVLKGSGILLSQELPGSAADVLAAVQQLGLEGVIAKRKATATDTQAPRRAWFIDQFLPMERPSTPMDQDVARRKYPRTCRVAHRSWMRSRSFLRLQIGGFACTPTGRKIGNLIQRIPLSAASWSSGI